jgi:hypothetical protein
MANGFDHGARMAQRVRAIVEAKDGFTLATTMETICDVFEIDHLGSGKSAQSTRLLEEVPLVCYPSPCLLGWKNLSLSRSRTAGLRKHLLSIGGS